MKKTLVLTLALGLVLMAGAAFAQPDNNAQGSGTNQVVTAVNDVDNANALGTQTVTETEADGKMANIDGTQTVTDQDADGKFANLSGTQTTTEIGDGMASGSSAAGDDAVANDGSQAADAFIATNQATGSGDNQDGLVNTDDSLNDNTVNAGTGAQANGTGDAMDANGGIVTQQSTGSGDAQDGLVNTDDSLNDNNLQLGRTNLGEGTQTITDNSNIGGASALSGPAIDANLTDGVATGTSNAAGDDAVANNESQAMDGAGAMAAGTQNQTQDGLINTAQVTGTGDNQDGLVNTDDSFNDNNLGAQANDTGDALQGLVNTNQDATGTSNNQQDGLVNAKDTLNDNAVAIAGAAATGSGNNSQMARNALGEGTQTITDNSNIGGASTLSGPAQDGLINTAQSVSGTQNTAQDGLLNVDDSLNDNQVLVQTGDGALANGSGNVAQDGAVNTNQADNTGQTQDGFINTAQAIGSGTDNTQQDGIGNVDDTLNNNNVLVGAGAQAVGSSSVAQGSGINTNQQGNSGAAQDGLINTIGAQANGSGGVVAQDGFINTNQVASGTNNTQQDGLMNVDDSPVNLLGAQTTGSGNAYDQNARNALGAGTQTITDNSNFGGASALSGPAINADDGVVTAGGSMGNIMVMDDPDATVQQNAAGNVFAVDDPSDVENVNLGGGSQNNYEAEGKYANAGGTMTATEYGAEGKYANASGTMTVTELSPEKGSQATASGDNIMAKSLFGAQASGSGDNNKVVGDEGMLANDQGINVKADGDDSQATVTGNNSVADLDGPGVAQSTGSGDNTNTVAWNGGQATNSGNNAKATSLFGAQATGSGNNQKAWNGGQNQSAGGSAILVGDVEKGGMNQIAGSNAAQVKIDVDADKGGFSAISAGSQTVTYQKANDSVVSGNSNIVNTDKSSAKLIVMGAENDGVAAAGAATAHSESGDQGQDEASGAVSFVRAPTPSINLNMNKSAIELTKDTSQNNSNVQLSGVQNGVQTVAYDVLEQTNSGIVVGDSLGNTYGSTNINIGNGGNVQGITSVSANLGGNAVNSASKVITNVSNNIGNNLLP